MKKIIITITFISFVFNTFSQVSGNFTDKRDGKTYETIKIGNQIWMAENLAFKLDTGCWVYNDDETNVVLGYLYNWEAALEACPSGWHLPSDNEWTIITNYLGNKYDAGGKMKTIKYWQEPNSGASNESLFNALPAGFYYRAYYVQLSDYFFTYNGLKKFALFWSSSSMDKKNAWRRSLHHDNSGIGRDASDKTFGLSVRCIKNK